MVKPPLARIALPAHPGGESVPPAGGRWQESTSRATCKGNPRRPPAPAGANRPPGPLKHATTFHQRRAKPPPSVWAVSLKRILPMAERTLIRMSTMAASRENPTLQATPSIHRQDERPLARAEMSALPPAGAQSVFAGAKRHMEPLAIQKPLVDLLATNLDTCNQQQAVPQISRKWHRNPMMRKRRTTTPSMPKEPAWSMVEKQSSGWRQPRHLEKEPSPSGFAHSTRLADC